MSIASEYTTMLRARAARDAAKALQAAPVAATGDDDTARGGEGGSARPDAAQRRWQVRLRYGRGFLGPTNIWETTDPHCPEVGFDKCRCAVHLTWPAALAYVNDQIRADALTALEAQP